jgi:periplasmic protein CpxP/Spy
MDWIRERSFQNWVIGILIVLNLVSLALVWVHLVGKNPPPARPPRGFSGVSVELLKDELGLSPDQVTQFEKLRGDQMGAMKEVNDQLDSLKLVLVDDMFGSVPARENLGRTVEKIGLLQANLEMLRFKHFDALVQICDQKQREKLQPILHDVFGKQRNAPRETAKPEGMGDRPPRVEGKVQQPPTREDGQAPEHRDDPDRGRPAPPNLEERLDKYAQRLSLSEQQRKTVEEILKSTRSSEESFRQRRPAKDEFDREKERLRNLEDQKIMSLLNSEQKAEFEKMLTKRGAPRTAR